ncbi:MAG TPA: hypothetical protein VKZ50_05345 [bacterium]|nr:hypothetical protein [bacterium]
MMRVAGAICAMLLVIVPAAAQDQGPYVVSPGVGIGTIKLGMSITMASAILGTPNRADLLQEPAVPARRGTHSYTWPDRHLVVETDASGSIFYIGAAMPGVATADGLGCGSNMDDVQDRLGVPAESFPVGHSVRMIYDHLGIQFSVSMVVGTDFYHRVEAVGVFAPR